MLALSLMGLMGSHTRDHWRNYIIVTWGQVQLDTDGSMLTGDCFKRRPAITNICSASSSLFITQLINWNTVRNIFVIDSLHLLGKVIVATPVTFGNVKYVQLVSIKVPVVSQLKTILNITLDVLKSTKVMRTKLTRLRPLLWWRPRKRPVKN